MRFFHAMFEKIRDLFIEPKSDITNPGGDFVTNKEGYSVRAYKTGDIDIRSYKFINDDGEVVARIWFSESDNRINIQPIAAGAGVQILAGVGNPRLLLQDGQMKAFDLPTSAPAESNCFWNDGGTLKIS